MWKNTAGQKWTVFAFDRTTNAPKTGDAANITAKINKDWAGYNAVDDTNPTEKESGYYEFDLSQAETNADALSLISVSGTENIIVVACPAVVFTKVDLEATVDAIKAKTDNLPADPADDSDIDAQLASIAWLVTSLESWWTDGGRLDMILDAILTGAFGSDYWQAHTRLVHAGERVWYVSKDGNDGTGDGTALKPYLTIGAAVGACASGDTIQIGPGTYVEAVDLATPTLSLTLQGAGLGKTILTTTDRYQMQFHDYCTVRDLSSISTHVSGAGILVTSKSYIRLERIYAEGVHDGLAAVGTTNHLTILDSVFSSTYDGAVIRADDVVIENSYFFTDSTVLPKPAETCALALWSGSAVVRNSTCVNLRAGTEGGDTLAVRVDEKAILENCIFDARVTNGGATGDAVAVKVPGADAEVLLRGCSTVSVNAGSGAELDLQQTAGMLAVSGTRYDVAKTAGIITHVPPVAEILADTDALDGRVTAARAAKIDNLDAAISTLALASVCTEARLAELDAANLPADVAAVLLDRLPYALDACVMVEAGTTDVERGTNLATAYTAACALTPGGAALSRTNRACVLLPPGGYDVPVLGLTLDTQYVDLIATDPQRGGLPETMDIDVSDGSTSLVQFRPPPTVVYASTGMAGAAVVEQAVQDIRLIGFAIAELSGIGAGAYHAFRCSAADNAGSRYDKMLFWHKAPGRERNPVSFAQHTRGTWRDCIANSWAWRVGGNGEFSAQMYDCHAGQDSFAGDEDGACIAACRMVRCTSHAMGFGGCLQFGVPIDADSVFMDCEAGLQSFGLGKKNEGVFIRCRGGDYCFGSTTESTKPGEFAGYAEDCVAGEGGFGGRKSSANDNGKCTGTLVRCISRGNELPTRLEGATLEGCLLTTGAADQDGVTLLDSGSRIHHSTILVVEGGTGIPINAAAAQSVSAAGNRHNNRSASKTGLGANVTNTGAGEPAAILEDTNELQGDWADGGRLDLLLDGTAVPSDVQVTVAPASSQRPPTQNGGTLQFAEGSAETLAWHIEDSAGDDYNFTDYTVIELQVYDRKGALQFERTLAAGHITVVDASGGDLSVTFTAANLAAEGTYQYELWGNKSGEDPTHVVGGPFVIENTFGPGS